MWDYGEAGLPGDLMHRKPQILLQRVTRAPGFTGSSDGSWWVGRKKIQPEHALKYD